MYLEFQCAWHFGSCNTCAPALQNVANPIFPEEHHRGACNSPATTTALQTLNPASQSRMESPGWPASWPLLDPWTASVSSGCARHPVAAPHFTGQVAVAMAGLAHTCASGGQQADEKGWLLRPQAWMWLELYCAWHFGSCSTRAPALQQQHVETCTLPG